MDELPADAEGLLAVAPEDFVAERKRVVKELRDADRTADAEVVARLRKPPPVVLAVNRAARARPQAAKDAARAAERVRKTQLGGDPDAYSAALRALDEALELLAEVALAHLDRASETMRRRLRALLRNAVADDEARAALARGALRTEVETAGFDPFAGMTPAATRKGRARKDDSSRTRAKGGGAPTARVGAARRAPRGGGAPGRGDARREGRRAAAQGGGASPGRRARAARSARVTG